MMQPVRMLSWRKLLLLALLLLPLSARAEWMTATGQAEVQAGQYDTARRAAQEDALRQIAWRANAEVSSESRMEQGQLTLDRVSVRSNAQIRNVRVIDEQVLGNLLKLTVVADVTSSKVLACEPGAANGYRKQVAVLAFALEQPAQANFGGLEDIDRSLAGVLVRGLNETGHALALEASHLRLYNDLINAPATANDRQALQYAVQAARSLGSQFVVSGVIRDLGVRSPEHFKQSAWQTGLRLLGMRDRQRAFAVEIFVHDGFSGVVVYRHLYRTQVEWHAEPNLKVGFGTDAFWQLEYGKAVRKLLSQAVAEVTEHLRCMPFMTRITRVSGDLLQFGSGANNGVKPGDELRVYRAAEVFDAQQMRHTELTDVELALKVTQVQPGFAQGRLEVDAGRANIQPDDLLVAW